jgi:hypothetical protein
MLLEHQHRALPALRPRARPAGPLHRHGDPTAGPGRRVGRRRGCGRTELPGPDLGVMVEAAEGLRGFEHPALVVWAAEDR